jgi:hypothetical protein
MAKPTPPAPAPAPAPNPDPAVPSASPVPAAKRPPIKRVIHPNLKPDAAGNRTVKLTEWPADYSSVKHKALSPDDFEKESVYLREQAKMLRKRADQLDAQAVESDTLGSPEQRKAAKKLRSLQDQMAALEKQLIADNVDIAALRKAMGANSPPADAVAA